MNQFIFFLELFNYISDRTNPVNWTVNLINIFQDDRDEPSSIRDRRNS